MTLAPILMTTFSLVALLMKACNPDRPLIDIFIMSGVVFISLLGVFYLIFFNFIRGNFYEFDDKARRYSFMQ